jgi:transcriptional regulator with XRE-family HTH domain
LPGNYRWHRIDFLTELTGAAKIDALTSIGVTMLVNILSPQQLGLLIRATRRTQKLRLDDAAGTAGVGHVFVREVERGKPTVQLGRVMKLLGELGIELKAEVSDAVMPEFRRLESVGVKPLTPRRSSRAAPLHDDQSSE